jgi:glucosamine-6-phosphate deaminase
MRRPPKKSSQYGHASKVEEYFLSRAPVGFLPREYERIPVVQVRNYVELGQLSALRFLEWVIDNPEGVVSLPTGKSPEFFIRWLQYFLTNWSAESRRGIIGEIGLQSRKPSINGLRFVQIDEFFPMNPAHERSFSRFVRTFYLDGLGLDRSRALLIDTYNLTGSQRKSLNGIESVAQAFPDGVIDLRLRIRQPSTELERLQKKTIAMFDQFCEEYESRIRAMGGIGFFLGGIGPDGHIAFNVRGSSHYSPTRLTQTNYETQAAAAADLGGIESARAKAVITIGLQTITWNRGAVAVVIAAGDAKSRVVADAVAHDPSPEYPATCLQKLPNARFYVTTGAAARLQERFARSVLKQRECSDALAEKLVIDGSLGDHRNFNRRTGQSGKSRAPAEWSLAATLCGKVRDALPAMVLASIKRKIEHGLDIPQNQRFLHTGPHHDDIELAYFPLLHHLVRSAHNENFFCYCTSGFTSVTDSYLLLRLRDLRSGLADGGLLRGDTIERLSSWKAAPEDITGYLNAIALQKPETQSHFISRRVARRLLSRSGRKSISALIALVNKRIASVEQHEPGRHDSPDVQVLKGWIREFEAELVWAHFGVPMDHVRHLRLSFYSDNIFPHYPDFKNDVVPIIRLMEEVQPTTVTLALDPEGSGPDTHFKTLIAIEQALDAYVAAHPDRKPRVWGYRNVWSRFHLSEVNMVVPVSLNSLAVLHSMFNTCFVSQTSASFPSYELDGTFSQLAQKIWVEQHNDLLSLLGRDYFYENVNPMMRRSYGAIYLKDMSYGEFHELLRPVREFLDDKQQLGKR